MSKIVSGGAFVYIAVRAGHARPGGVPSAGVYGDAPGRTCAAPTALQTGGGRRPRRPAEGQDPSLRGTRKRQAVGSSLDRSGQACARAAFPGENPFPTAKTNVPAIF